MAADANFDAPLSDQARSLWGKSDYGVGESWLPLYVQHGGFCWDSIAAVGQLGATFHQGNCGTST